MFVYTQEGSLVNLNTVQHIEVVEDYPEFHSYSVCADGILLYECESKDEGKAIIDRMARAIKADTTVYYGRFRA
jgi:hypothetical protein